MHVMAREIWTDERLDDLVKHMDERFVEVVAEQQALRADLRSVQSEVSVARKELGELRAEIKGVRGEVKNLEAKMDSRFEDLNRTLQTGFGLIGSVLVGLMALLAAQL